MDTIEQRITDTLSRVGIVVLTVRITGPQSADVTYQPGTDETAAAAAMSAFNWSAEAHAAWKISSTREAALTVLASNDTIPVSVRVFVRDIYTQLNDVREAIGLPRILEPEILGRIVPAVQSGLGEF